MRTMGTSYLAVGYECNHKCICCPLTTYDRLHKSFRYEEIAERIARIRPGEEREHMVLSGGEPMLHPDFLRIVALLAEKGYAITVLSNASLCRDPKMVRELKRVIPDHRFDIVTAIHSSTPAIHDRITGVPGSLLETLEGLDHLVEEEIPVTIKHIFNRISLPSLLETFQYLEHHFPPRVGFQFCTMDYSGRAGKNVEELFVSMEEIRGPLEQLLDELEKHMVRNRKISLIETPLCLTDPYYWKYYLPSSRGLHTYTAPNTDERPVCYHVESQCGPYYPPCEKCAVRQWCSGIWRSAYQYQQEGMLDPIKRVEEKKK